MDAEILAPAQPEKALSVHDEVERLVAQINAHELRLAGSYARLGSLLQEVKTHGYWMNYGFPKFSAYLDDVRTKIRRKRSQVYAILAVAETLLPYISEQKLEDIGITRAYELRRLVKEGRRPDMEIADPDNPSELVRLMDYACRPKVTKERLHVVVSEVLHVKSEPKGAWYELNGFYVLPEEKQEIDQFWETGKRLLELPTDKPEHEQRKEVFLAAVRESLGQWSTEIGG